MRHRRNEYRGYRSRPYPAQSTPRRRRMPWGCLTALVLFLLFCLAVGLWVFAYKSSQRAVTFTVEEKERVCKTDGDCEYLLFTDKGTFEVTDGLIIWRFDSSDVYGDIKEGRTYNADVIGWRQGFLSMYPNVVEAREAQ